jgi:hypothetical protein
MPRYRVMRWNGIPTPVKVFADGREPHSVALDPWFMEHVDRVAMERDLVGSDAYLEGWGWSEELERDGSAEEVAAAVVAELEAEWAPRRQAWEQGANAADV